MVGVGIFTCSGGCLRSTRFTQSCAHDNAPDSVLCALDHQPGSQIAWPLPSHLHTPSTTPTMTNDVMICRGIDRTFPGIGALLRGTV